MRASLQTISQNENNFRKQYSSLSHVKNVLLLLKNFLLLVKKWKIDHKSLNGRKYMAVDQVSEANRMMALAFKTKKRKMTTEAKKKEDDAKEGTEEPEAKLAKL